MTNAGAREDDPNSLELSRLLRVENSVNGNLGRIFPDCADMIGLEKILRTLEKTLHAPSSPRPPGIEQAWAPSIAFNQPTHVDLPLSDAP